MKLDQGDIDGQQHRMIVERNDALDQISEARGYLENRTNFSDSVPLVHAAAHLGLALRSMAVLQPYGDWQSITLDVISEAAATGTTPLMQTVVDRLQQQVLLRIGPISSRAGPFASMFMTMVTNEYVSILETCRQLIVAAPVTYDVCGDVAKEKGLSQDEVFNRLKTGDEAIGKAVGRAAFMRTVAECVKQNVTMPPLPPQFLAQIGVDLSEVPEGVRPKPLTADGLMEALGLTSLGTPLSDDDDDAPSYLPLRNNAAAQHESIKVG